MAIKFNDTDNLNGLVQLYENEIGVDYGYISGNTTRLKEFTARVNLALDRYFSIAVQSSGTWELDDRNHEKFPNIYHELTSGRRDYELTNDGQGNAILDVYKVLILPTATSTEYVEVLPADENSHLQIINEGDHEGVPTRYAKRGTAIYFDVTPNYTVTRGIKLLINRESSYFTTTDTKTPGYPYHQEYFYLKPAFEYARKASLSDSHYTKLRDEILKLEGDDSRRIVGLIAKAYGRRKKDETDSISGEIINSI